MKRRPTVVMMTTLDTTATAAQNAARRYMRHGVGSPERKGITYAAHRGFFAPLLRPFYGEQGREAYACWFTFSPVFQPASVSRPDVWKHHGEPRKNHEKVNP